MGKKLSNSKPELSCIITNIGQLVTMHVDGHVGPLDGRLMKNLGIIKNGAVAIENSRITAVGTTAKLLKSSRLKKNTIEIDAGGRLVTPGLVDPHTHPVFAGNRAEEFEQRLSGKSYLDIAKSGGGIKSTVRATRKATAESLFEGGKKVLDQMLRNGVTTVEGKSGYGLDTKTEFKMLDVLNRLNSHHAVDVVVTFLGAHEVPDEFEGRPDEYVALVCGEMIPSVATGNLAEFCDAFCEKGVFTLKQTRVILQTAQAFGMKLKLHADQFHNTGGAELAAEFRTFSADHLDCVSDEGIHLLKKAGVIPVLLPGSVWILKAKHKAPARRMIDSGLPVAIGTDYNPGSSPVISMTLTMSLACIEYGLTPAEALCAATLNAAHAIDRGDKVGSLSPGKIADLVIWEAEDFRELSYWIGKSMVHSVIKNGKRLTI